MRGSKNLKRRQKQLIKSAYLTAIFASSISIAPAYAQTAEWTADGETNQWSEAGNWDPQDVPGVPASEEDVARFNDEGSRKTDVDIDVDAELSGIRFNESAAYTLNLNEGSDVVLSGSGIRNNSNETQTFNIGDAASLVFLNEAVIDGEEDVELNITGGGYLEFYDTSSAGGAFINNNGGTVGFFGDSTAENAIINNASGLVDVSGVGGEASADNAIAIGSLSGAGNVFLGSTELILGGLNENDEISGDIADEEMGGQVTKIGDGTLTLSGENTYTGNTNVNEGTLDIGATGELVNSHVIVGEDGTLEVNGHAHNGVTNSGLTNVNAGGHVESGATGILNREGGELNVFSSSNEGDDAGVYGSNYGVANDGGTVNIHDGGIVEGRVAGLQNNSGVANVLSGGEVRGDQYGVYNGWGGELYIDGLVNGGEVEGEGFGTGTGVENHGITNVNAGGEVYGGEFGAVNGGPSAGDDDDDDDDNDDVRPLLNVNSGAYVEGGFAGLENYGTTNINGGYVYGGEYGAGNLGNGVINIAGDSSAEQFGVLEGEDVGLYNEGTANVNAGGRIEGGFIGVENGEPEGDFTINSHEEGHVPVLNVNEGGTVNGGSVGVENNGITNVNGGSIYGGDVGVANGGFGGFGLLSHEEAHEGSHAVLNVNEGGLVYGDEIGVRNGGGFDDVPQLTEFQITPLSHDEDGFGGNEPVVNVNAGGEIEGGFIGVENDGTLNVNEGGFVSGGQIGIINNGEARIDGVVVGIGGEGGGAGVENYGYLTGAGFIINDLYNDGVLQPGAHDRGSDNRYGTLRVDGDADFSGDSTFITNIRGNQNSQLFASGTADLAGDVEAHVDSFGLRDTYAIVETDEGLVDDNEDGNFNEDVSVYLVDADGNTTDAEGSIIGELSYDDFFAYLTLTRASSNLSTGYGDLTRNQRALASMLDEFYNVEFGELGEEEQEEFLGLYNEFFAALYDGDVPQNLSDANGESLTGLPVAAQAAARRFMDRLLNQLQQQASSDIILAQRKAPRLVYNGTRYASLLAQATAYPVRASVDQDAGSRSSFWATIGRANDDVDSDANNAGFDIRATEYQIGYTRSLSPRTTLGLSIGKSDGRFEATDADTEGDTDTLSFGAALRHDSRDWYATGGLSYNRHSIDSERSMGGFEYSGDTSGRTIELSGEVGKKIISGQWRLEPHLSLNLANTRLGGYGEDGGPGALEVGSGKLSTRRVGLGVRIASNNAAARFRPYFSAAYQREFGDRHVDLNNSLAGIGAFDVEGTDLGRNIWKLRLGADARVNDRLSIIGEIGGSWRDNNDSQYVFGGVKYGF